jgi:hypothetical protein
MFPIHSRQASQWSLAFASRVGPALRDGCKTDRERSYFTTTFTSKYFDPSLSMVPSAFRSVSA